MTIPISEDTLLPSHTMRNVVSADCTVVIAYSYSYRLSQSCMHRVRNVVSAVLVYSSTSRGGCLLTQCDMTTLLLGNCVMCVVSCSK